MYTILNISNPAKIYLLLSLWSNNYFKIYSL